MVPQYFFLSTLINVFARIPLAESPRITDLFSKNYHFMFPITRSKVLDTCILPILLYTFSQKTVFNECRSAFPEILLKKLPLHTPIKLDQDGEEQKVNEQKCHNEVGGERTDKMLPKMNVSRLGLEPVDPRLKSEHCWSRRKTPTDRP